MREAFCKTLYFISSIQIWLCKNCVEKGKNITADMAWRFWSTETLLTSNQTERENPIDDSFIKHVHIVITSKYHCELYFNASLTRTWTAFQKKLELVSYGEFCKHQKNWLAVSLKAIADTNKKGFKNWWRWWCQTSAHWEENPEFRWRPWNNYRTWGKKSDETWNTALGWPVGTHPFQRAPSELDPTEAKQRITGQS